MARANDNAKRMKKIWRRFIRVPMSVSRLLVH